MLRDVSLKVEHGEFVALLGANGVGKSTLLKTIAGLLRAAPEPCLLDGRDITHERAETIARLGIGLVPEGRQLFGSMSVIENLLLGAHSIRRRRARGRRPARPRDDAVPGDSPNAAGSGPTR